LRKAETWDYDRVDDKLYGREFRDGATRPLAFIKTFFDWRASLPKDDMRGQVLKLGINFHLR
jgi:hypothetical protein